jgi:membrane-associated protease RseP (regulator of RpoE activity)
MVSSGPIPSAGRSELDRLRQAVSSRFPVYETRLGPQSVLFAVHIDPTSLEPKFDALRRELGTLGYIPILRRETGEEFVEVIRRPRLGPRRPWINVALLAATVATTVFAGAMIWTWYVGKPFPGLEEVAYGSLYFAAPLLAILGVHETAHYVVARRRHLDASLPYFIPIPPPYILGTFGAFVSMREPFPDRKALFDVGASGPIAGFAMSIPIALAGLSLSTHAPAVAATYCGPTILGQPYGNLLLGPSLFWDLLSAFFPKSILSLHPLALAGWVGVLVTAINLLPAGTLDGGHVFRAILGERARLVSYAASATLFGLGIFYLGWLLFAALIFFLGLRHPPPLNDVTPLDRKRLAVGVFVAAILVSGFVIVPLSYPTGQLSVHPGVPAWATPPPGEAVAARLNVTITNGEPIPQAFVYTFAVLNASVTSGSNLSGSALAAWEANATWTFFLANGSQLKFPGTATATLPESDYLSVGGYATGNASAEFSDTEATKAIVFTFSTNEIVCPPETAGSASTDFPVLSS